MKKTYGFLLTTLLYTGISSVYAAPEVFTNANDFIQEHSKVITFEAIDGQTSPAAIASQFDNIQEITFKGASISQEDGEVSQGAPFAGSFYARLKTGADGYSSYLKVAFKNPVDAVGAYWGGMNTGGVAMITTLNDGSNLVHKPVFFGIDSLSNSASKCDAINGFLGVDRNDAAKITAVTFFTTKETVSIDNIYFGDAIGRRYGAGDSLLPSAFHQSQCETTTAPEQECIIYGVNDQQLNNSELFFIQPEESFKVSTLNLAYSYDGYDLEGLDVHPTTTELFATSGNNTGYNKPKGFLFKINKNNGGLTPIGSTGFNDVAAISFRLDGTLWGWAKGTGLIQINPENAQSILQVESTIEIEDISWNTDGSILYGVAGTELYTYDFNTHELAKKCDNFPSEVEAIDTLQDGTLVFALHENDDSNLHSFNTESCTINATAPIATNYTDIEGIASNCN